MAGANALSVSGDFMVDKMDVHIPATAEFRLAFQKVFEELRTQKKSPVRTGGRDYSCTVDLRPYGNSAILHLWNKHHKNGGHKLELVDTASMNKAELLHEPHELFQLRKDQFDLRIMRLDLAADIPDVPVTWFKERVRVDCKRRHREEGVEGYETHRYSEDGKKRVQTLYYGVKPNQVRIYDKKDEYLFQYERMRRGWVRDLKNNAVLAWLREECNGEIPEDLSLTIRKRVRDLIKEGKQFPSFEDVFKIPENGYTLTRFERQIGGGRFPEKIRTVSDLDKLPDFNPFQNVRVLVRRKYGNRPDPQIYDGNGNMRRLQTHCTGLFLKRMAEECGMHRVIDYMNLFPSRQATNKWQTTYRDYLPDEPAHEEEGLTAIQLYDFYRDSVSRQLAA